MGKVFISDFKDGDLVETLFLVASKSIRETKNGDPYLCITCQDRSGTIEARAWDNALAMAKRFDCDEFIALRGRVSSFRDELQLTVMDLEKVPEERVALKDFLPHSRFEAETLFRSLQELIEKEIRSPEIKRFFGALFGDAPFCSAFQRAPAAVTNHHAFLAGLLEHSLSMARIALQLGRHYEGYYPGMINTDLVIAGAILHDMGKVSELTFKRSFDYSTEGRLIGHIQIGAEKVSEVARSMTPRLDQNLEMQLKHLILSHHGRQEYGSPVTPKSAEATLLHQIDMIDSRMNMCWNLLKTGAANDGTSKERWTEYSRLFGGSFYQAGEAATGWLSQLENSTEEPDFLSPSSSEASQSLSEDSQKSGKKKRSSTPGSSDAFSSTQEEEDHNLRLFDE